MTLQASGPITLSQIAGEHGGSNPLSLSKFYRGNASHLVHPNNTAIPASGQIKFSNFYSTRRFGYYTVNSQKLVSESGNQLGFNAFAGQGSLRYNAKYRGYNIAWVLWNEYDNVWGVALEGTNIPESTISSVYHPSLGTVSMTYIPNFLGIVTVWNSSTPINLFPEGTSTEIIIL